MKKIYILSFYSEKSQESLVAGLRPHHMWKFLDSRGYDVTLITSESLKPMGSYKIYPVDSHFGWSLHAFFRLWKDRKIFDILITTAPPHSISIVGVLIKLFNRHISWIHDLRDLWTDSPMRSLNFYRLLSNNILEKSAFRLADFILANTDYDNKIYTPKAAGTVLTVRNGSSFQFNLNSKRNMDFVYMGGTSKGQAVAPIARLFENRKVDFFGEYNLEMELFHNINYKGIIDQEEVSMVLHRYKYGIVYLPKGYESGGRVNQKMYDYLMCGCIPIIINGSREMKSLVGPNFYISLEESSEPSEVLGQISAKLELPASLRKEFHRDVQFEKILKCVE